MTRELIRRGHWSFAHSSWDEVSVEAKDVVRRLLTLAPHKRPTAQEALDLPWVRPNFDEPPLSTGSFGARGAEGGKGGKGGKPMPRTWSLPGSRSFLRLLAAQSQPCGLPPLASVGPEHNTPARPSEPLPLTPMPADHVAVDAAGVPSGEAKPLAMDTTPLTVSATPTTAEAMADDVLAAAGVPRGEIRPGSSPAPGRASPGVPREESRPSRGRFVTASRSLRAVKAGRSEFEYTGELISAAGRGAGADGCHSMLPNELRHGYGEVRYECGSQYTGQWVMDKRHGFGRMVHACGDVYEGEWRDGKYHGKGTYTARARSSSRRGDDYEGEWVADKPHGSGRLTDGQSGVAFEGTWVLGLKEGKFTETQPDGTVVASVYECDERTCVALSKERFQAGVDEWGYRIPMFTAKLTCERVSKSNLARCVYEGDTVPLDHSTRTTLSVFTRTHLPGRVRHGHGSIRYECGNLYDGQWVDDLRSGKGTYRYACGDVYEGEWQNGMYNGKGTYKGSLKGGGGDDYEGEWRADKPHGHGRYLQRATGDAYEGEWKDGQYHGKGVLTRADGSQLGDEWIDGLLVPLWQRGSPDEH